MKPSDVTEDIAVVAGAIAGTSVLDGHPEVAAIVGAVAAAAAALTGVLLKQGN